ncbi:MAG: hypothetical protein ACREH8_10650 [Opitutaceae bacterium]
MTRNILIFLATFAAGALIAFIARAALHQPQVATAGQPHTAPEPAGAGRAAGEAGLGAAD